MHLGIFNVSMIITNEYGRSSVRSDLYRISPTSQLYNFQTYAGLFDRIFKHRDLYFCLGVFQWYQVFHQPLVVQKVALH